VDPIPSDKRSIRDANDKYHFSQFLGDRREGRIDAPEFSMDWGTRMPEVVWRREIGAGWSGVAVARGLALTLQQTDEGESLVALRLNTGQPVWEVTVPGRHLHPLGGLGPRSTPTIVERGEQAVVVAQTALGHVICADLETGTRLWDVNLLQLVGLSQQEAEQDVMWGRSGSPLVLEDMVVVPLGGASKQSDSMRSLIAFGLLDGVERWRGGTTQIAYTSPVYLVVDGVPQIVSVNEGNVTGLDQSTGQVLWSSPWPSKSNGDACATQPVAVDGNRILLGKGYAQGSKLIEVRHRTEGADSGLSRWDVTDVWANTRTLKTKFTNPVIFEGMAYALSDGVLECVDPQTGTRSWRGARFGQGQMLVVNGGILVLAEDGRIASIDRSTGTTIAEVSVLDGITWNPPAVAGPYLLVRNGSEMVCLSNSVDVK
jgi:outer membrane protein assembly factor BamB